MKHEKYPDLLITDDYLEYEFVSIGPKGAITKIIQFTPMENKKVVNLAFGNKRDDGSLDDLARNNNNDRDKILATVVSVLKIFFQKYPDTWVFFTGSSPERTRLYRMVITLNYEELITDFEIIGLVKDMDTFSDIPFKKGVNYFGFLVRQKKS